MTTMMTVNGKDVSVGEAVRLSILHDEPFLKNTIDFELLRQHAAASGIANSDAELQVAADELRYTRGLETVDALNQWMKANNQTLLSLQDAIDGMLLRNKIRSAIPDSEVAAYFAEHQTEFESVDLYSCRLDSADKANELKSQILEEDANFHAIAMEHSSDADTRMLGGYAGRLTRSQMTGDIEAAAFSAKPGAVIGPVKTDKGYNLFKVGAVHKPGADDPKVKESIRQALFNAFLDKLRSKATVTYSLD